MRIPNEAGRLVIEPKETGKSSICIMSLRYEYLITLGSLCEMLRCVPCLVLSCLSVEDIER